MFKRFKKKKRYAQLTSCVDGILISLEDVDDPVFSSGAIGRGLAVKPMGGPVRSPIDGVVKTIFPTGHALGLVTEDGLEFLIHIGIDTVKLKGEGFKAVVSTGQHIQRGDVLVEVDWTLLEEKGYCTDTILLLTTDPSQAEYEKVASYGTHTKDRDQTVFQCRMLK